MTTNKLLGVIAALVAATGLAGCSHPVPSAPSATSPTAGDGQPSPPALVVLKDPLTGLSTSDLRDAHGHIVQFTTANELIWIDGTHLSNHQAGGPGPKRQQQGLCRSRTLTLTA